MTLATGEKHRLSGVEDGVQPSWSPHSRRIAYWATLGTGVRQSQRDIWTASVNGSDPVPVTSDAALDWCPVWSPDGRYLYFSSDRAGSVNLWRIEVDEITGKALGQPEALTAPSPDGRYLSLSADGRLLAYASFAETSHVQKIAFEPITATVSGTASTGTWRVSISFSRQRVPRQSELDLLLSRPSTRYLHKSVRWVG